MSKSVSRLWPVIVRQVSQDGTEWYSPASSESGTPTFGSMMANV